MKNDDDEDYDAVFAKLEVMLCVRNTEIEHLHAGVVPTSVTGDYSDVVVTDGTGREIPWNEVSHFDDDAMRELMKQIVNRVYSFKKLKHDPMFQKVMERWFSVSQKWDDPEMDQWFLIAMDEQRKLADLKRERGGADRPARTRKYTP